MLPQRALEKRDGRRERSARTHKAIVASLIDSIEEGNLAPTAAQIARRSSVALRSIRQHFPSREELFIAAVEEHERRALPMKTDVDARMPLAARVTAFVEARARELEFSSPVRRAASASLAMPRAASTAIGRATDEAWQRRRREVERSFAAELDARPERQRLLDTLDLLSHGRTWDTMRHAMRLSAAAATELLRASLEGALKT